MRNERRHAAPLLSALALFCVSLPAGAQEAQLTVLPPAEYQECLYGPAIGGSAGYGVYGYQLLSVAGARLGCLESTDARKWLWQWDANAVATGGTLANTRPYHHLIGASAAGDLSAGYRFSPSFRWSPYLEGSVAANLRAITEPGVGFGELRTINSLDNVGGLNADGALRVSAGYSLLDSPEIPARYSLKLTGFLQSWLRGPQVNTPARAFFEVGARGQYDLANSLALALEGLVGIAPRERNAAMGTTTSFTHWAFNADVRKRFGSHFWLSFAASFFDDSYTIVTAGSSQVAHPAEPVDVLFALNTGYAL